MLSFLDLDDLILDRLPGDSRGYQVSLRVRFLMYSLQNIMFSLFPNPPSFEASYQDSKCYFYIFTLPLRMMHSNSGKV